MDRKRERPPPGLRSMSPEDLLWSSSLIAVLGTLVGALGALVTLAGLALLSLLWWPLRRRHVGRLVALLAAPPWTRRGRWRLPDTPRSNLAGISPLALAPSLAAWLPLWLLSPRLLAHRAALDSAYLRLLAAEPLRQCEQVSGLWDYATGLPESIGGALRAEALAAIVATGLRCGRMAEVVRASDELARLVSAQSWHWPCLAHARLPAAIALSRLGQTIAAERRLEELDRLPLTGGEAALLRPLAEAAIALDRGEAALAADILRGIPSADFAGDPLARWWMTLAAALAGEADLAAGNASAALARLGGTTARATCAEAALVKGEALARLGRDVEALGDYLTAGTMVRNGPYHERAMLAITKLRLTSDPSRTVGSS